MNNEMLPEIKMIDKASKDTRSKIVNLGQEEIKYIIGTYYDMQDSRIRANNQSKALNTREKPNELLSWLRDCDHLIENEIKKTMEHYVKYFEIGNWLNNITGIGPVISAGLIAFVDFEKAKTAGNIFRLADLDPSITWMGVKGAEYQIKKYKKELFMGESDKIDEKFIVGLCNKLKRNPTRYINASALKNNKFSEEKLRKELSKPHFNPRFKQICFQIGESVNKQHNRELDLYGKLMQIRKEWHRRKNESGQCLDQANRLIENMKPGVYQKEYYPILEQGKVPTWYIHACSKQWTTKMFLSHFHEVGYRLHNKRNPPKPYATTMEGNHNHYVPPPFFDLNTWKIKEPNKEDIKKCLSSVGGPGMEYHTIAHELYGNLLE